MLFPRPELQLGPKTQACFHHGPFYTSNIVQESEGNCHAKSEGLGIFLAVIEIFQRASDCEDAGPARDLHWESNPR